MGTSSSRADQNVPRGGDWADAKRRLTSFTRGTGWSVESVIGAFVSAIGGPHAASPPKPNNGAGIRRGRLSSSVRTGQVLGGFLGSVGSVGLDETLHSIGLGHLIGRTPHEVLSSVADYICGDGALLDDSVVRSAVIEVLGVVFDESEDSYAELRDRWDSQLDEAMVVDLIGLFLAQSVFQRFLADLGDGIESNAVSAAQAAQCEHEVWQVVQAMIAFELGQLDPLTFDWQGPEGEQLIQRNLRVALAQLEEYK